MAKSGEDTPLLKQYFSIKAQHPEALLLYRVGDFYETYSDDALLASKVLGLVLTRRSNGDKGSTEMAGFPHHALESYLQKIVRAGYKVAICDQLEDPNLVKTKLVKRGVTEILTPGIAFGEGMLESSEHNYLAGLNFDGPQCGAAFLDVSTGTFKVAQGSIEYISTLLSSFRPKELVVERDVFRTAKEWGINHYRFHSWTPPEAAFAAADEVGIYLQPELPFWGVFQPSNSSPDALWLNNFFKIDCVCILRDLCFNHLLCVGFNLHACHKSISLRRVLKIKFNVLAKPVQNSFLIHFSCEVLPCRRITCFA